MTPRAARPSPELRALARAHGIQTSFVDLANDRQHASTDALLGILAGLGVDIDTEIEAHDRLRTHRLHQARELVPPVVTVHEGAPLRCEIRLPRQHADQSLEIEIRLEAGGTIERRCSRSSLETVGTETCEGERFVLKRLEVGQGLPLGYHRAQVRTKRRTRDFLVISHPRKCHPLLQKGEPRRWGLFLPLYALKRRGNWGIGDFSNLIDLMDWTFEQGGDVVGILPVLAAYLDKPCEPSPYAPVSRQFWNEIYIDPTQTPEWSTCSAVNRLQRSAKHRRDLQAFRSRKYVDYRGIMARKRVFLQAMAKEAIDSGDGRLDEFLKRRPDVRSYAQFRAACERHGVPWQKWPERMRGGSLRRSDYDEKDYDYHLYVQMVADEQLRRVANESAASDRGLYLDLPLGVHGAGYDTWKERDAFMLGLSAGSPPDPFFTLGQNWGLPPLHPEGLRRQGYQYLRNCLHHNMQYAGVLRIDHVMGFHRLYCVPDGLDARDGAYVSYPANEWFAVLALESYRCGTAIIGEDLGTVPRVVRRSMDRWGVARMHVLQFDWGGTTLSKPPERSVTSLNTHDMPPFAAFWTGAEIEDRQALGLMTPEEAASEREQRSGLRGRVVKFLKRTRLLTAKQAPLEKVLAALLQYLAKSKAQLLLINLEDLWLERQPQNVPGTSAERPNWLRKARLSFEQFTRKSAIRDILRTINRLRKRKARV